MVYRWSLFNSEELFESSYILGTDDGVVSPVFTKTEVSKIWEKLSIGSTSQWSYDFNLREFVIAGTHLGGENFEYRYGAVYDAYFGAWVYRGLKELGFVFYRGKVV